MSKSLVRTRIAYVDMNINKAKYERLSSLSYKLGMLRTEIRNTYGAKKHIGMSPYAIRDEIMNNKPSYCKGVYAQVLQETILDEIHNIKATYDADLKVCCAYLYKRIKDPQLLETLKKDLYNGSYQTKQGTEYNALRRKMRNLYRRGVNKCYNQIIVSSQGYDLFKDSKGSVWISIPVDTGSDTKKVPVKLTTNRFPGLENSDKKVTLRLIFRNNKIEIHYQQPMEKLQRKIRPTPLKNTLGLDASPQHGYIDSEGNKVIEDIGEMEKSYIGESTRVNKERAKLKARVNQLGASGNFAKARRIKDNNLGTIKKTKKRVSHQGKMKTKIYTSLHSLCDRADHLVTENLSHMKIKKGKFSKKSNHRLSRWTRGVINDSLQKVSDSRGSRVSMVNPAYTSQICNVCGFLGIRKGSIFTCDNPGCSNYKVDVCADTNAARNTKNRLRDSEISLYTPYKDVYTMIKKREEFTRNSGDITDISPNSKDQSSMETVGS